MQNFSRIPYEITERFALAPNDRIIQISLGDQHSSALSEQGQVFLWGDNQRGQIGNNSTTTQLVPLNITANFTLDIGDQIISLSLGHSHSAALSQRGKVFIWGFGFYGQLGTGFNDTELLPVDITNEFDLDEDDQIKQLSLGESHSAALSQKGQIFTWGYGAYGQLGDGGTINNYSPNNVTHHFTLIETDLIDHIELGNHHSSALTKEGKLFMWGNNHYGRIGNGSATHVLVPTDITSALNLEPEDQVITSQLGGTHTFIQTAQGVVMMWGYGGYGQLGRNSNTDSFIPVVNERLSAPIPNTINFQSNGGSTVESIKQIAFGIVNQPANPTKVGYTFDGWYADPELTEMFEFTVMPDSDITVYAKWSINQYSISFQTDGGGLIPSIFEDYDTPITPPTTPTKVGYTFSGWNPAFPEKMPAEDLTLTAQWTINTYTIHFNTNGGSLIEAITQNYGTPISSIPNPTKAGYRFNGYSIPIPSTMPAETITIQAFWLKEVQIISEYNPIIEEVFDKIPSSLIEKRNIEVLIQVQKIANSDLPQTDSTLLNTYVTRKQSISLFDIQFVLKESGQEDVLVTTLTDSIQITLTIPEMDRGYQNYRVLRVHNGIVDVLETIHDETLHTLTFETDRFSSYAIVYDIQASSWAWWLLLLLLIPVGYLGYRYRNEVKTFINKRKK